MLSTAKVAQQGGTMESNIHVQSGVFVNSKFCRLFTIAHCHFIGGEEERIAEEK